MPDVIDCPKIGDSAARTLDERVRSLSVSDYDSAPITVIVAPELVGAPAGRLVRDLEDADAEYEDKRAFFEAFF